MVVFELPFWRIDAVMLGRGGVHPIGYVGRVDSRSMEYQLVVVRAALSRS